MINLKKREDYMDMGNRLIRDYNLLNRYYFIWDDDIKGYSIYDVRCWYEKIKKACHDYRMTLITTNGNYKILPKDILEFDLAVDYLKDDGFNLLKPNTLYYLMIEGKVKRFVTNISKKIIVEN